MDGSVEASVEAGLNTASCYAKHWQGVGGSVQASVEAGLNMASTLPHAPKGPLEVPSEGSWTPPSATPQQHSVTSLLNRATFANVR